MKRFYVTFICISIVALIIQFFGIFQSLEDTIEDNIYQQGDTISNDIYVIGIDEQTLEEYGSFDVWGRDKIADLINLLMSDEKKAPAVIAVDVGFFGYKDQEIDDKLVEAVRNAGNVVLTDTATFGSVVNKGNQVVVYEEPFKELKEACYSSGHSNVQLDQDGVVRYAAGDIEYNDITKSSFDVEIYKAYLNKINQPFNDKDFFGINPKGFYIVYSGPARTYYGSVGAGCSFIKVLNGDYPISAFKDSIVFIGAYASGMQDHYYTSIQKDIKMNGVEIHANIVNQFINGVNKIVLNDYEEIIVITIVCLVSYLIFRIFNSRIAIITQLILGAIYAFGVKHVYDYFNLKLPILVPVVFVIIVNIIYLLFNYIIEYQEKQRIVSIYAKYLSAEVANNIADKGELSLGLGGIKKDVAILFVDIRGFTTISESLSPERVVNMLNKYLKITTKAIFDNKGTVDKFIGDATMGIFNAPLDLDDYTYKAVCAGLEMVELANSIDDELDDDLKGKIGFGVGINCGEAVVGNIGTEFRMEYTAIGDIVNTASRLEGVAKTKEVIISQEVYERVKNRIECLDAGKVKLKGKAEEYQIYKAIAIKG